MLRLIKCLICLNATGMCCISVSAASFVFSNANPSGLNGLQAGNVTNGEISVLFSAGPGSSIIATDAGRLGVDSRSNSGVTDPFPTKLNMMGGTSASQGESISFSFDRPGILDKLHFDGVKDESLEYFTLRTPNGTEYTLFDFEVEFRLNFQGFIPADLGLPNFTQADDEEDDVSGLGLSFAPGEVFTLTYGEVDYATLLPGYVPTNSQGIPTGDIANGARFEGLSVTLVPEPGLAALLVTMLAVFGMGRHKL